MKLSLDEFRDLRRRRPELFSPEAVERATGAAPGVGRMAAGEHAQPARALDKAPPAQRGGQEGGAGGARRGAFRVTFVACLPRFLDDDNLANALKAVRDEVAAALGVDDGDQRRVRWEYGQIETRGEAGVLVKMEVE